ncbi:hypothetical protein GCM10007857_32250 [Bradyrhizobium iriomotense]|uniref:Uncharacterized protein n=1 Tax=Bradyrhizobium iriomotense TaxID=441950 RepID=A0ABQ6AWD4_9BRAD|nr:hypothetical protein GCM10007857_32250 [Bradyrhizobium iriomotense]
MSLSGTIAKCTPTFRNIAVRSKTEAGYNFADLVLVAEARPQSLRGTLNRGLIEALLQQALLRFRNQLGGLLVFRSFGIHGHFKNMTQQRIQFTKRVSGNRSRYPQLARSGGEPTKVRVTIRNRRSEQTIE